MSLLLSRQCPMKPNRTAEKKAISVSLAKHVIYTSDREGANEFASLLARVREGVEVIIEHADESSTRFPWAIDTTSEEKIYIRWCCIDLLRPPCQVLLVCAANAAARAYSVR